MSTALWHYQKGEELLAKAELIPSEHDETNPAAGLLISQANAHFAAAAVGVAALARFGPEGMPEADRMAWYQAASEGPAEKARSRQAETAGLAAIRQESAA